MIKIISVGNIKRSSLKEEVSFFTKRIGSFTKLEFEIVSESKFKNREEIIKDESEKLMNKLKNDDYSICLDRTGEKLNSIEFSKKLDKIICYGKKPTFIIGGAYGTSGELKSKVDFRMSLSEFTIQHDIVLLVLMEQIYRAYTLLKGHPYHK